MADQFLSGRDQAQLSELEARLKSLNAEMQGVADQIAAEAAALRETQRTGGGGRTSATALPSLEKEVVAVQQQVADYTKLNALIAERIKLEAQAAAATERTSVAAAGGGAGGAAVPARGAAQAAERTVVLPPIGAGSLGSLAATENEATVASERLGAAAQGLRTEFLAANAAVVEYDMTLARTGGLSAAAIDAMARGSITVRELGSQVGQVITKFGGWTLAAGAVFGAFGAVSELKSGIVDTSSALQGLSKFIPTGAAAAQAGVPSYDPDRARQQLIEQAKATVTPIKDVGDTAQQFAKAFHSQTDVFTATHVSLTATKLDNISLADSYKYLTAIVQESGTAVSKLPGIFDQISAAQDKLGARVSVLLPALSGSIGAVQSSGGDTSQLLGLEALTAVRTGFEGPTIANMYRQGASRYFNQALERGIRQRYGINPNEGFTQGLIQAIEKTPSLKGAQVQELASGFFGPRFGPRAAPLFRGYAQLPEFLQQTQAGKYPGFADTQLAKTTEQANNQLKLLKINLQAIGAELSGSGIATPLGAFVSLLNHALNATQDLIAAWSRMPGILKDVASYAAVGGSAVLLARRFNVGGNLIAGTSFGETAGGGLLAGLLGKSPAKLASQQAAAEEKSMRDFFLQERASGSVALRSATYAGNQEAAQAAAARILAADQSLAELKAGAVEFQTRINAEMAAQVGAEGDLAAATIRNAALAAGLGGVGAAGGAAGAAGLGGEVLPFGAGIAAGVGGNAVARYLGTKAALLRSGAAFTGLGAGTAGALEVAALVASHPFLVGAAAYGAYDLAAGTSKEKQQDVAKGIAGITNAKTPADAIAQYNKLTRSGGLRLPLIGHTLLFQGVGSLFSGDDTAARHLLTARLGEFDVSQKAQQAGSNALGPVNALLRTAAGERGGQQRLTYQQALEKLMTDKALALVDPTVFQEAVANVQSKLATAGTKGATPAARMLAEALDAAHTETVAQYAAETQGFADKAKIYGTRTGSSGDISQLISRYAAGVHSYQAGDPQTLQTLSSMQTSVISGVDKQVTDLLNLAHMSTSNAGQLSYMKQALGAVTDAQDKIHSLFGGIERVDAKNPKQLAKDQQAEAELMGLVAQKRQTAIQDILGLASTQGELAVSRIGGIGPKAELSRAEEQLRQYQNQLQLAKSSGADAQAIDQIQTKINQQMVTILQDKVSYYQQLSQALTQYQQGATADPVQQQQIAINNLQKLYSQLVSSGVTDPTTLLAVLGQQRAAVLQQIADKISQEQAGAQMWLSQANIGQPQQVQLQNAITAAQRELSYVLSLPKSQVNPATIMQAYSNLYQAQGALAQYQIQQGQQLIQAEAALKEAQTFDPVAIAEYALEGAKQLLAYDIAHHMSAATITQDQANVAADMKAKMSAQWDKDRATIDFLASTYQITGAQEIERLMKLRTAMVKAHASYAQIQAVTQEIWNLEYGNAGQLNLNTGSLHLPSTYEVKSAILGGRGVAKRRTTAGLLADVKTEVRMNVVISRNVDLKKFTDALGQALGTSVNSVAQAAGLY